MAAPELFGRYRVVRQLGAGAFASVWLARDEQLDGSVAVKVLADNWASRGDVRERFVDEARMLRRADSDRIVRVHDIGELDDGRPYFVMTYADAGTLADRLSDEPMSPGEALWYACETALGVAVLHARGIIHRDLKPSNVLLRSDVHGDGEQVLVSDLGLAKAIAFASGITLAAGTPGYMPPEQAEGTGLTYASDVYALGALTYRLLAGRLPRQVATPLSVLTTAGDPVPALDLVAELPAGVERVLRRALARDPAERHADAGVFVRALGTAAGELSGAAPELAAPLSGRVGGGRSATSYAAGVSAGVSAANRSRDADAAPTVVSGVRSWPRTATPGGPGSGSGSGSGSGGSGAAGPGEPLSLLDAPAVREGRRRRGRGGVLAGGIGLAVVVAGVLGAAAQPAVVADARAAAAGERIVRQYGLSVTVPRGWSEVGSAGGPIPGGGEPVQSLVVSPDVAGYATGEQDGVFIGLVAGARAAAVAAALTYPGCTTDAATPGAAPAGVPSWTGQAVGRSCGASSRVLTWVGTPVAVGGTARTLLVEVRTGSADQSSLASRVLSSVAVTGSAG